MRYFPTFVDVTEVPVVVVGDGEKALQKLRLLTKSEAALTLVSPAPSAELVRFAEAHRVTICREGFAPAQLDGARLVFSAHDCVAIDLAVAEAARVRGIAVNVVDRPHLSTFITPAIVDRDPVTVAIGTEGTAPLIAREIKAMLDVRLPSRLGEVARSAHGLRDRMMTAIRDGRERRRAWQALLNGEWRRAVLKGDDRSAAGIVDQLLADARQADHGPGHVSLVGAGPGDPDLLTLRALERLQDADVIVVDGLVSDAVLDYARRDAERIHVGKTGYGAAVAQDEINAILVREALKGSKVVRLKAGDPFVFGRAVEELRALRAAGIAVDIVPGITAAHACAASIELPMTLRETIRSFALVTGATSEGAPDLDWRALAAPGQASAVYMGVKTAPVLRERLIAAGAKRETPVVIVENGARPNERSVATTLGALPDAIAAHALKAPSIVFIGVHWDMANLTPPARVHHFAPERPDQIADRLERGDRSLAQPPPATPPTATPEGEWSAEDIANATMWIAG
ncbi:MAG: siroheme synthase CysG [Pseudomonadota bacterium]